MICIHCGRKIKYGAKSCPRCREKTEFSERFFYEPQGAPLPGADCETGPERALLPEARTERRERGLPSIRNIFARRKKNKER